MGRSSCRVRLFDNSPTANIDRSDSVSRASEPALTTEERCLTGTVGLRNMPAGRTSARSISGIDSYDADTGKDSLVLDKGAKLMERPGMMDATLSLANRNPVADALELFKSDPPPGAFGFRDQSLADRMVDVRCKPGFLALTFLQEPLGGLGAFGLKAFAEFSVPFSQAVDLSAGISFAVGIGGNVDDTKINAKPVFRIASRRFGDIHNHGQIKDAVTIDEIGLPANPFQSCGLVFSEDNGNDLAALERQDGYTVHALPGENALVVDDCSVWAEGRLLGFIPLVRFGNLADGADSQLCREIELFPDVVINDLLEPDFIGRALPESNFGNGVAGGIEPLHYFQESGSLFGGWLKFNHQCQVHKTSITQRRQ